MHEGEIPNTVLISGNNIATHVLAVLCVHTHKAFLLASSKCNLYPMQCTIPAITVCVHRERTFFLWIDLGVSYFILVDMYEYMPVSGIFFFFISL